MIPLGRSRLRPVPPAVLSGLQGGRDRGRSSLPLEARAPGKARLVSVDEARAVHELACLLDPVQVSAEPSIDALEDEIRTMFGAHPESLRALLLGVDQMRAAPTSQERSALVADFERLLEGLTIRHELWGGKP